MKLSKLLILLMCVLMLFASSCDSQLESDNPTPEPTETDMPEEKNTILYQLPTQTPQQMMSYVIITKDESCIVIDGGNTGDGNYLLNFLKEKTGKEKPEIDAWFFSHAHSDHVNAFIALVNQKKDEFAVKKIYYNFPSKEFVRTFDSSSVIETMDNFHAAVEKLDNTEVIIPQEGDRFDIGSVEFEILMVQDEEANFMRNGNVVNNSCMIFRMKVEEQTVLFLGDTGVEQGIMLLVKHRDYLKSDMVQMAHHGQNGVNKKVYETINPSVCLWPTPAWLYNNDNGGGYDSGPWLTIEVRGWMEELGVKHHFVDKDGLHEIVFPFELD